MSEEFSREDAKARSDRGELILFRSQDGKSEVQLRVDGDTVWLTQLEIADLFATTKQNVSLHARNILEEGELRADSVVKESLTTAADGKNYKTQLYSLPMILAIGYRVRSARGTGKTFAASRESPNTVRRKAEISREAAKTRSPDQHGSFLLFLAP